MSLLLSMTAFTLMQCFFTLSAISTRETYFEKYQDAWDIMITVKNTGIGAFGETERLREVPGVEDVTVYRKAGVKCCITEEELSGEFKANGGFSYDDGKYVTRDYDGFWVNAPIIILDDAAFLEYCGQIGAPQRTDGAVIRNLIRDVTNPDFLNHIHHERLHQHLAGLALGDATAAHIEERSRVELAGGGPVGAFDVIVVDEQLGFGVHPRPGGGQQVAVALVSLVEAGTVGHLYQPLERPGGLIVKHIFEELVAVRTVRAVYQV